MKIKITRERLFVSLLIVATFVYIAFFVYAFFSWFIPFLSDRSRFMFWELEYEEKWMFRWFATDVPQIERDAFVAFIIFGFPLMAVFSYSAFYTLHTFVFSKIRRWKT